MLSALNLCLVALGMVILLGGVWLVSFHAGSGRVDVGTWQEGDDDFSDEESSETYVEDGDEEEEVIPPSSQLDGSTFSDSPSEPSAFRPRSITTNVYSTPHDFERQTQHNEQHHTIRFPSQGDASITEGDFEGAPVLSPQSPPISPSSHPRQHHHSRRQQRFSLLQSPDSPSSAHMHVPPGGFSIGLSPVSPGFAIVPKRRVSGLKGVVRRAVMRRTLSESDVVGADLEINASGAGSGEDQPLLESALNNDEPGRTTKAKARWKWLRGMFTDNE